MPLHPTKYAEILTTKMKANGTTIWLVNTGWTGGPYGIGKRMDLKYTRAMISAALDGSLEAANEKKLPHPLGFWGFTAPSLSQCANSAFKP